MDLQLETRIVLQLQEIARAQERPIIDIIRDAIADYVETHTQETAFREKVRGVVRDHHWLLAELEGR
jgi:predicted transcriptional regulator